jgi:APA family basic amino acid/polyamine antiporter
VTATALRRGLGLRSVVSTSTGLAFAAIEYLAAAGLVAYVAGNLAWVAILTAGLFALIAWACFGELCGLFPTAAAIRLYLGRAFDDRIALVVTFTYLSTIVLVLATDAFIVGSAMSHALGASALVSAPIIAILLGIATVANLRGTVVAARVQDLATYAVVSVTVVVAIIAILHAKGPDVARQEHHGPLAFLQAVALGVLLYSAFEWVTTNAEEVEDQRDIGRGMLISLGVLGVTCALVTVAMGHLLSRSELASAYPQLYLGSRALGAFGYALMAVVTGVTAINTFNSGFITASRFVYATAREGSLPPAFARLNDNAVPYVPVYVLAAASTVVAVVVALTGDFQVLLAVGASLEAGIYALAAACVLRLRLRIPTAQRPFVMRAVPVLPWVGVVVFGFLALIAAMTVGGRVSVTPLVVIAVLAAVSAWYVFRVLPGMRAAAEAARAAAGPRRPRRPVAAGAEQEEVSRAGGS